MVVIAVVRSSRIRTVSVIVNSNESTGPLLANRLCFVMTAEPAVDNDT